MRETFGRITRLARDLAHKQKKEVEVIVTGDETELDKNMVEALVDPLTHLIRNSIDHGIDAPDANDVLHSHLRTLTMTSPPPRRATVRTFRTAGSHTSAQPLVFAQCVASRNRTHLTDLAALRNTLRPH